MNYYNIHMDTFLPAFIIYNSQCNFIMIIYTNTVLIVYLNIICTQGSMHILMKIYAFVHRNKKIFNTTDTHA
jgi:hypothetical protein